jgi:hypothetical protein
MLCKIISGGQTGADQGGLLAAAKIGLMTGGTAPAGYMTATGPCPLLKVLGLTAAGALQTRTKVNIQQSDATVILSNDMKSPGTMLTKRLCAELKKPVHIIDLSVLCENFDSPTVSDTGHTPATIIRKLSTDLYTFIRVNQVSCLNVAGNRERFKDLRTTWCTEQIVSGALEQLDVEGFLLRDNDF